MLTIIHRKVIERKSRKVRIRGPHGPRGLELHSNQCIVWISLTPVEAQVAALTPAHPVFPAVLDTGCTFNLLLHEHHLVELAGIAFGDVLKGGEATLYGHKLPTIELDAWVHHWKPGDDEKSPDIRQATKLSLSKGVVVSHLRMAKVLSLHKRGKSPSLWQRVTSLLSAGERAEPIEPLGNWTKQHPTLPGDDPPGLFPRLPLLGMRALRSSKCKVEVDWSAGDFSLHKDAP